MADNYWNSWGSEGERKYNYQKQHHGQFDQFGFPLHLPEGGIAPFAQYESERIVAQRNAELMRQAVAAIGDARAGALGLMESYRPGGAASLASGIQMQAGMGIANMLAASRTQAPDLLYQYRRDRARRARQQAKQASLLGGIGSLAMIGGAIAGGPVGIALAAGGGLLAASQGGMGGAQGMQAAAQAAGVISGIKTADQTKKTTTTTPTPTPTPTPEAANAGNQANQPQKLPAGWTTGPNKQPIPETPQQIAQGGAGGGGPMQSQAGGGGGGVAGGPAGGAKGQVQQPVGGASGQMPNMAAQTGFAGPTGSDPADQSFYRTLRDSQAAGINGQDLLAAVYNEEDDTGFIAFLTAAENSMDSMLAELMAV